MNQKKLIQILKTSEIIPRIESSIERSQISKSEKLKRILSNQKKINYNEPRGLFSQVKNFFIRKHFPKKRFHYFINGERQEVVFEFNDSSLDLPHVYYTSENTLEKYLSRAINFPPHRERLLPLVDAIRKKTFNLEKQAKIAVSLVQNIPYKKKFIDLRWRFPFEVIKENKGICGEKTGLLVFLLKELGFGTAVFDYDKRDYYSRNIFERYILPFRCDFLHANAGVKCKKEYQYEGSGYAVIETTAPKIITDYSWNDRRKVKPWAKRLPKNFKLIPISDGKELDVSEEYFDAQEFIRVNTIAESGSNLSRKDYEIYCKLADKYGLNRRD